MNSILSFAAVMVATTQAAQVGQSYGQYPQQSYGSYGRAPQNYGGYGRGDRQPRREERSYGQRYQPIGRPVGKARESQKEQAPKRDSYASFDSLLKNKAVKVDELKEEEESYEEPVESYEEPVESYKRPQRSYEEPVESYKRPQRSYEEPVESYKRPQRSYEEPAQSYEPEYQEEQYEAEQYENESDASLSYDDQGSEYASFDFGGVGKGAFDQSEYEQPEFDYAALENDHDGFAAQGDEALAGLGGFDGGAFESNKPSAYDDNAHRVRQPYKQRVSKRIAHISSHDDTGYGDFSSKRDERIGRFSGKIEAKADDAQFDAYDNLHAGAYETGKGLDSVLDNLDIDSLAKPTANIISDEIIEAHDHVHDVVDVMDATLELAGDLAETDEVKAGIADKIVATGADLGDIKAIVHKLSSIAVPQALEVIGSVDAIIAENTAALDADINEQMAQKIIESGADMAKVRALVDAHHKKTTAKTIDSVIEHGASNRAKKAVAVDTLLDKQVLSDNKETARLQFLAQDLKVDGYEREEVEPVIHEVVEVSTQKRAIEKLDERLSDYGYSQQEPSYRQNESAYGRSEPHYVQEEPEYRQEEPSYRQEEPVYEEEVEEPKRVAAEPHPWKEAEAVVEEEESYAEEESYPEPEYNGYRQEPRQQYNGYRQEPRQQQYREARPQQYGQQRPQYNNRKQGYQAPRSYNGQW